MGNASVLTLDAVEDDLDSNEDQLLIELSSDL